ncbi:hypothetical protein CYMTET_56723 [Cymbomonas tetramitiformis]|uniref:Major facilitator superfamily (MFS) profile domain-containing protein n=1 Tax=Cymbomonas tetramitiformis TaxID=36881 RepID=A0AAE0BC45_9CHLO|nr:hypothetical protein CYMTET_56723 [Cymbomonas tetramitiformis]
MEEVADRRVVPGKSAVEAVGREGKTDETYSQAESDEPETSSPIRFRDEAFTRKTVPYFVFMFLWIVSVVGFAAELITLERNYFAAKHVDHSMSCEDYDDDDLPEACKQGNQDSLDWSTWSDFISQAILSFTLLPILGAASDIYGRRPLMLISGVTNILPVLFVVLCKHFGLALEWYYVFNAVASANTGITYGLAAVADVVSPRNRTVVFGLLLAGLSFGAFFGPFLGLMVGQNNTPEASLCIQLLNLLSLFMFLQETLPSAQVTEQAPDVPELEQPLMDNSANASTATRHLEEPFPDRQNSLLAKARRRLPSMTGIRILFRTSLFRQLTLCVVLNGIVFEGNQDFTFLYMQEHLGFTQNDQQATFVLLGASLLLAQLVLLPAMLRYMKETRVLLIGMGFSLLQQAWLIFLNHKVQGMMALCVGSFSMLVFPSVGTLKANSVSSEEQGQIQGALYGAQALGKGAGPVLYNSIYRLFTKSVYGTPYIPVAPYIFGTIISFLGVGVAATICRDHKKL